MTALADYWTFNRNELGLTRSETIVFVHKVHRPHEVYLAECAELKMLKIGKSSKAMIRVHGINQGSSTPKPCRGEWRLLGSIAVRSDVEMAVHEILAPFRHPDAPPKAREWYRDCEQVRGAFDLLQKELAE